MISQKDKFIMESFDLFHTPTRKALLDEAKSDSLIQSITYKFYEHITEKVDEINFGTIALSKGDITKIENYDVLVECVRNINNLYETYNVENEMVENIQLAIDNMIKRTKLFEQGFNRKNDFVCLLYSTMVLSIVSSISLLISTTIQYIKEPDGSVQFVLNKESITKTKNHTLFDNIKKFNNACAKGQIDRSLSDLLKANAENLLGAIVLISIATVLILSSIIIPMIRDLIYFFYNIRVKTSDYFEVQARFLEANSRRVSEDSSINNNIKIASKQSDIASKMQKIADVFAVNFKTSDTKTKVDIDRDEKLISSNKAKIGDTGELSSFPSLF